MLIIQPHALRKRTVLLLMIICAVLSHAIVEFADSAPKNLDLDASTRAEAIATLIKHVDDQKTSEWLQMTDGKGVVKRGYCISGMSPSLASDVERAISLLEKPDEQVSEGSTPQFVSNPANTESCVSGHVIFGEFGESLKSLAYRYYLYSRDPDSPASYMHWTGYASADEARELDSVFSASAFDAICAIGDVSIPFIFIVSPSPNAKWAFVITSKRLLGCVSANNKKMQAKLSSSLYGGLGYGFSEGAPAE